MLSIEILSFSHPQDAEQNNSKDFNVFLTVFSYCLLIIILPVVTFFGSKQLFDIFNLTSTTSNIYSAIAAVVCLHLALGLYLYKGDHPEHILMDKF